MSLFHMMRIGWFSLTMVLFHSPIILFGILSRMAFRRRTARRVWLTLLFLVIGGCEIAYYFITGFDRYIIFIVSSVALALLTGYFLNWLWTTHLKKTVQDLNHA